MLLLYLIFSPLTTENGKKSLRFQKSNKKVTKKLQNELTL